MTGLIASIVEAYGELRVNKGRILLSLIGVAFSVFALTLVMGGGSMLSGALQQSQEQWTGRHATLQIFSMGEGSEGAPPADEVVLQELEQMGITQRTRVVNDQLRIQTPSGVRYTEAMGVDPAYGDMFRVQMQQGRWLADSDQQRLAPALVVNEALYEVLGRPELGTEPVTVYGPRGAEDSAQMIIVGVVESSEGDWLQAYIPAGAMGSLPGRDEPPMASDFRAWVPAEQSSEIRDLLASRLRSTPAGSFDVSESSISEEDQGLGAVKAGVTAVALVILVLGALGLVNISLVTVRYRVREIGIRRSYGATGGRIFVGVLMESVVATVIAGAVGVTAAVALMKSPWVTDFLRGNGLVEIPPFPVEAVLMGLAAATAVGVLAGALPALIATRIKVIDAIRS